MRALLNLGSVLAALNQWEAAERAIQQSQFIAVQLHLPAEQLERHVALGEIALQRNDIATAIHEYQQSLPLATDSESEEFGRFQRLEARIAVAQGDLERAVQLLQDNLALFARLHNVPEAERTRQLLGQIAPPSTTREGGE